MFTLYKTHLVFSILLLTSIMLTGAFRQEEILFVPWGNGESSATLSFAQGGPFGVESFAVDGNKIALVNTQNHEILFYTDKIWTHTQKLNIQFPTDIQLNNDGTFYILTHDELYNVTGSTSQRLWRNPSPQNPISRFIDASNSKPSVLLNRSNTITIHQNLSKNIAINGIINKQKQTCRVIRNSNHLMTLLVNGKPLTTLTSNNNDWGSGEYLGSNMNGDHYVIAETILNQIPLQVHRYIYIIDVKGIIKTKIRIPNNQYSQLSKEFIIEADGSILEMISAEDGIHLFKWTFSGKHDQTITEYSIPQFFYELYDPNAPLSPEFQPEHEQINEKVDESSVLGRFPVVTRQQSLATADTYVDFSFTANSNNLTNGQISDPDGHAIETPPWVNMGTNYRTPYQWGGFSTPTEFTDGLAQGRYAGDKATSAVSYYGEGVDCSGFVCRTWNMPTHYSTYMMVNTTPLITQQLPSWYDLQAGDAVHKVGHVRLMVMFNPNGTVLLVEAAGRDWRVNYYSYSLSELSSYTPRVYAEMEGMTSTIEQATLSSIDDINSPKISWAIQDTSGIAGYRIYQNDGISEDWTIAHAGILPPTQNEFAFESTYPASQFYYIKSISSIDNETESFPSDTYGFLDKGSNEQLLIVDGFDRTTGSYPFPYHDFAMKLGQSLSRFTYNFATTDNASIIDGSIDMAEYTAVFWLVGDESTLDETLSNSEQALVQAYLQQGGKFFISGSEIGWDLDYRGEASDKAFSSNYLKLKLNNDDAQSYTVNGATGTAFENLTLHYDDGDFGVYEEDYPDSYTVNGGSSALLNYSNGQIAMLGYSGVFNGGTSAGQVVAMAFPYETIYSLEERNAFTLALLDYFQLDTTLDIQIHPALPENFILNHPYPNPFNPSTTIDFSLAYSAHAQIDIVDIMGRVTKTLANRNFTDGPHQIVFNAKFYATGVYFVRLRVGNKVKTQKILLLK